MRHPTVARECWSGHTPGFQRAGRVYYQAKEPPMTRVLSSACVVLLLLGLGGRAWAGGKPPIAILGLEVYDNGSGIDPEPTKASHEVTAALRERARVPSGP